MSKTYGSILRLAVPASLALGLILGSAQSLAQSSAPATTVTKPAAQATETKPATPSKDIDFTQSGYPDFIAEVTGLSGHEPWGRWSEGDKATFRFKERLPKKIHPGPDRPGFWPKHRRTDQGQGWNQGTDPYPHPRAATL